MIRLVETSGFPILDIDNEASLTDKRIGAEDLQEPSLQLCLSAHLRIRYRGSILILQVPPGRIRLYLNTRRKALREQG